MVKIAVSEERLVVYEAMEELAKLSPAKKQAFENEMNKAARIDESERAEYIKKYCPVARDLKAADLSRDNMLLLLKIIKTHRERGMRAAIQLLADNPEEVPHV